MTDPVVELPADEPSPLSQGRGAGVATDNSHGVRRRRNRPPARQHALKSSPRPAGAGIIAAEFFEKLDIAVNEAEAPLYVRLGGISLTPLRADLESRAGRRIGRCVA